MGRYVLYKSTTNVAGGEVNYIKAKQGGSLQSYQHINQLI